MFAKKIFDLLAKNSDQFPFKNEEDKQLVVDALQKRFDVFGSQLVSKKNGVAVTDDEIIPVMHAIAKDYLLALTPGRYVPKYADTRDTDTKIAHSKEVFKLVDMLFDRYGFKFRGEHLGDNALKQIARARIAEDYLFEGQGENNEVVFRKHNQGLFSDPVDPLSLIFHIAGPYLDAERTRERQDEIRMEIEAGVLRKFGVQFKSQIDKRNVDAFNEEVDKKYRAYSTITTNKKLPVQDRDEVAAEFSRRTMFKIGLRDESAATISQKRIIDFYQKEAMEKLNALPEHNGQILEDLKNWKPPAESWGFSTLNVSGYKMSADQL